MTKAFLIIDYQNAVLQRPETLRARPVMATIGRLAGQARAAGHLVVYVQHDEPGGPFERGGEGWEFPAEIAPQPGDLVVPKQSCDGFRDTELLARLSAASVAALYVSGYATDFCVDTTVRRAASIGLRTTVFADAHTTAERPFVAAQAIIDHHNWLWPELTNPGNPIRVASAAGDRPFDD